jgi:hypothetical protein
MYTCAKCDRRFQYREDSEHHVSLCDIAQNRVFRMVRGGGGRGAAGPRQTTIVPVAAPNPDVAAALAALAAEMADMRAEVARLHAEVDRLRANDGQRARRSVAAEMRARPAPALSFAAWLAAAAVTETHLLEVMRADLADGLEAALREALSHPDTPLAAVAGAKPAVYYFAPATDAADPGWRKMDDAEFEHMRMEFTRKMLARFDVWQTDNARRIELSETENQRNIACMSKIYGARGGALATRAAEFRRRVQRATLELRPAAAP